MGHAQSFVSISRRDSRHISSQCYRTTKFLTDFLLGDVTVSKQRYITMTLTLTFLFSGCGSIYRQGQNYLKAGEYEAARREFDDILEERRDDAEALGLKGLTYYREGKRDQDEAKHEQAISFFVQARNADKEYDKAYLYLGMTYEELGMIYEKRKDDDAAKERYSEAIQEYEKYHRLGRFSLMRLKLEWEAKRLRDSLATKQARRALALEEKLKDDELALQQETRKIPDNHIAVMDFENLGGSRFENLEKGIADFVIEGLEYAKPPIEKVLERSEIHLMLGEIELNRWAACNIQQKGRFLRANHIVTGVFSRPDNKELKIVSSLAIAKQDTVERIAPISSKRFFELYKPLLTRILKRIGLYDDLTPAQRQAVGRVPTESFLAFLAYCQGLDLMDDALDDLQREMYEEAQRKYKDAEDNFREAFRKDRWSRRKSGKRGEFSLAKKRLYEAKLAVRELDELDLSALELYEKLEDAVPRRGTRLARIDRNTSEGFALLEKEYESRRQFPPAEVTGVDVIAEFNEGD